ncbi:MAG TPA: hypothetical protein VGM06_00860 [Polyangiaceae bacterium]|jgi:hypothetical protein
MVRRPDLPPNAPDGLPELELELRTTKIAAPKARAAPAPEEALELAIDPRDLVLERAETTSMSVRAAAPLSGPLPPPAPPPLSSRSSLPTAGPLAAPPARAGVAGMADIASDAQLLADYGEPPGNWAVSPLYAYRVLKRRRELKVALAGRREEARRAAEAAENALVAFVDRVRGTATALPAYAGGLDELARAEETMRSRDRVLSTEQDAHGARLAQVDARLSALEAELAQAQRDERTAALRLADAQEGLAREEAKLKRAETELRAVQQRGGEG